MDGFQGWLMFMGTTLGGFIVFSLCVIVWAVWDRRRRQQAKAAA